MYSRPMARIIGLRQLTEPVHRRWHVFSARYAAVVDADGEYDVLELDEDQGQLHHHRLGLQ